ncbi:MAG: site-specific integrase, partial [Planctomycetota bacterium]
LKNHHTNLRLYLLPFFGGMGLSEITTTKIQEYRIERSQSEYRGKPPSASKLQKEVVTLRMALKSAVRHGWLSHLPDFSAPYRGSSKINHRVRCP